MIFTPLEFGKSVEGNDIEVFRSQASGEKYLYLLAGTHGDEVEGVHVLKELFAWLDLEETKLKIPMIVIPILNPDGYRARTRVNAHAVDLNRNYPDGWSSEYKKEKYNPGSGPLSEPENKFLDKLFEKFPPGIVLSFHSWKALINYNGPIEDVAKYLGLHNKYELADHIGYDTPGSLGAYVPNKFNAGVLTFECPLIAERESLKEIWEENAVGLKSLLEGDLITSKLGIIE